MRGSLLGPIGKHRRAHSKPSKGKRAAKRKEATQKGEGSARVPTPARPDLCAHIDAGFNAITRELQSPPKQAKKTDEMDTNDSKEPYSMVFVARGNQSPAFNCHFPKMIGFASKKLPPGQRIHLIGFSEPCSDRLSSSLGIARVSSIAIKRDAPGSEALLAFIDEHVPAVDIRWLDETSSPQYQPTRITSTETTVGAKKLKAS